MDEFPTLPALDLAQPRAYLRRCRDKLTSAKKPLVTKAADQGITGATSGALLTVAIALLKGLAPDAVTARPLAATMAARAAADAEDGGLHLADLGDDEPTYPRMPMTASRPCHQV